MTECSRGNAHLAAHDEGSVSDEGVHGQRSRPTQHRGRGHREAPDTLAHRLTRLAIGLLALAVLAFAISRADRLPGVLGDGVRNNVTTDQNATGLFYTEVDGWHDWLHGRNRTSIRRQAGPEP